MMNKTSDIKDNMSLCIEEYRKNNIIEEEFTIYDFFNEKQRSILKKIGIGIENKPYSLEECIFIKKVISLYLNLQCKHQKELHQILEIFSNCINSL